MEVVVVGAVLNAFLPKLWGMISDAHGLRLAIQGEITSILTELEALDACIQERKLDITGNSGKVINRARRLALDTERCICSFLFHQPCSSQKKNLHPRPRVTQFERKLKELREDLGKIRGEVSGLGKESEISPTKPEDPYFGEGKLVGMVLPIKVLIELLGCTLPVRVEGELTVPTTKTGKGRLEVISIIGFGGSGKTRLCHQVYTEACEKFGWQAWVRMGEKSAKEVREEILKIVSEKTSTSVQHVDHAASTSTGAQQLHNGTSTSSGVQHVNNGAKQSTNNWNWDNFIKALPDSGVGSRIIVTTTSQSVAEHCSSPGGHVYKMSALSGKDSEELFLSSLGKELSVAEVKQLSTLLKTCDGLPLALIESAKSFKGKKVSQHGCEEAIRKLCSPEDILTRMQWVLMKKYSDMSSTGARSCLLYFHMFPFENTTKRKFLIRRWLAEGLVHRDDRKCSYQDSALNYLQIFSDRNVIRSMHVSNNATIKSCRLHGTMHEFISRQSMSQDFVSFACYAKDPGQDQAKYVRRLSLHAGAASSEMCIDGVYLSLLRTLAVSGKACKAIVDFSEYKVLRVLDLKEWDYHDEVKSICRSICKGICKQKCKLDKAHKHQEKLSGVWKLVMLKYLGLPGSIGEVPRQIEKLEELETLDLHVKEKETFDLKVYGEVINLPRLKHIPGKCRLSTLDKPEDCVPEASRLETLSGFVTNGKAAFPKLMKHMKQLRKVKMWCDFNESKEDKEELKHVSTAIQDFIEGKDYYLDVGRSLSIDVTGCKTRFLESLEAPGRLTKLKLHGGLSKVPGFITGLEGITELCLSSTTLCGKHPLFPFPLEVGATLLPLLRYLKLVEKEFGCLKILTNHFPSLERICFVSEKSLSNVAITEGALKFLVSLQIMCIAQIRLADIQIEHLRSLKEIVLDSEHAATRSAWTKASNDHPNKPRVLFIGPVKQESAKRSLSSTGGQLPTESAARTRARTG